MKRKNEAAAPLATEPAMAEPPAAATASMPVVPTALTEHMAPVAAAAAAAVAAPRSPSPKAARPARVAKAVPAVAEALQPAASQQAAPPARADTTAQTAEPGRERHADKDKDEKPSGKPKLVRDSFTMPRADFALIAQLKERALGFRRPAKKSELLRAGLQALATLDDEKLRAALDSLAPLKAGRPKKG